MELLQLQYFLKIAETGNMTRAAEELFISQSSLSRTIARLEKDLGVQLFDRIGRQIHLNAYGQVFLNRTTQMFFQLDEARKEINDLSGNYDHHINVAVTIPGILTFFMERYVDMTRENKFSQFYIDRTQQTSVLECGKVDFVITGDRVENDKFRWDYLLHDSILALVPKGHPIGENNTISMAELIGAPVVCSPANVGIRPLVEDYFATVGAVPNVVFEENDMDMTIQLVQNQVGIAFIAQHNLVQYLQNHIQWEDGIDPEIPGIHMCRIRDRCAFMDIGVVSLRSRFWSHADKSFLSRLQSYCSDMDETIHHPGEADLELI